MIALTEAWARASGYDPDDVWRWLAREEAPPVAFVRGAVDAFWPILRSEDFGVLPSAAERAKLRDEMQSPEYDFRARKVGRPPSSKHLFARALAAEGITLTEWAAAHKDPDTGRPYKRERVKSWIAEGDGGRPIPRHAADIIATEFPSVPANARTWKNGIKE